MRLGLSLSRKKVQWKCCIKPLIRVEHIRIILRAQSGSCYAAVCVVLLAPEFSPLIGVLVCVCACTENAVCAKGYLMWCIFVRIRLDLNESWRCVHSSRCKVCRPKRHQLPWLKIQMGLPHLPRLLPFLPPDFVLSQPEVFSFQHSSLH